MIYLCCVFLNYRPFKIIYYLCADYVIFNTQNISDNVIFDNKNAADNVNYYA